jgi:urea transport system substrate-binding protein
MAISEVAVKNSELLAIAEINKAGGVLGKQLEPVIEDGASDWPTFAEKAQKLISVNKVATTFGGWTSASRKAMLPVFERNKALLYYPVQYEGLEASPYIFYTGATTNQQIIPGLEYLKSKGHTKLFLVGSDYVFPRTANKEIKAWAKANGVSIVGEEYTPLAHTEYSTVINKIKQARSSRYRPRTARSSPIRS